MKQRQAWLTVGIVTFMHSYRSSLVGYGTTPKPRVPEPDVSSPDFRSVSDPITSQLPIIPTIPFDGTVLGQSWLWIVKVSTGCSLVHSPTFAVSLGRLSAKRSGLPDPISTSLAISSVSISKDTSAWFGQVRVGLCCRIFSSTAECSLSARTGGEESPACFPVTDRRSI